MAICHDVLSKVRKLTNPLAMLLLVAVALVVVVVYTLARLVYYSKQALLLEIFYILVLSFFKVYLFSQNL